MLAFELTKLVHGEAAAEEARAAERALFASGGDLSAAPTTAVARDRLAEGVPVVDLLVETGLLPSKKEARRKIEEGAVHAGDAKVEDARARVTLEDLDGGGLLLKVGKKSFHRVVAAG